MMNKLILIFLCIIFLFSCGRKAPVTFNKDLIESEKAKKQLLKEKEKIKEKLLKEIEE